MPSDEQDMFVAQKGKVRVHPAYQWLRKGCFRPIDEQGVARKMRFYCIINN